MAFVTMKTIVLGNLTSVVFATAMAFHLERNCAGDVLDACGICGGDNSSCVGCTYELACNYDPEAIILDASLCEFGNCPGCTIIGACNYNPTVVVDDAVVNGAAFSRALHSTQ